MERINCLISFGQADICVYLIKTSKHILSCVPMKTPLLCKAKQALSGLTFSKRIGKLTEKLYYSKSILRKLLI